ncbi:MAG: hypothetical protein WBP44_14580 [Gammaproteobacteria bacterium]|jgi:hypothetical protein
MKALAAYIVSGRWQAALIATICGVMSFMLPWLGGMLNYLAAAVVGLVTLYVGMVPGLQVLLIATTVTVLFYQLVGVQAIVGLVMVLLLWLPSWMAAVVLLQTRNLGHALRAATLFGVCLLLVVFLAYGDPAPWWLQQVQLVESTLEEAGVSLPPRLADPELQQQVAALLTGMVVASLVIGVITSLLLSRWWQSLLVHPGGFREEFYALRLGYAAGLVTLAVMVMARLTQGALSDFSAQLAMILLVPYLLVGLAVIHSLLKQYSRGTGWLVLVYVLLAVFPQATLLLAAGGLMDTWIDFRRRLGRGAGGSGQ